MERIGSVGFALAVVTLAFGCEEPTSISVRVTSDRHAPRSKA
jgi:hypothetical protein